MTKQQDRVERNTPNSINDEIELQLRDNIRKYATADKSTLSKRIAELEKEWYMDRMLITNASSLAGMGVLLAATVHKKWLILPGVVLTFLLQHGVQGWCPPLRFSENLGYDPLKKLIGRGLP